MTSSMVEDTMQALRNRFGRLVAAQRRRLGWTQNQLSSHAEVSVDMISRIEAGATGARFTTIDKLARAMNVDPAEFFSPHIPGSAADRPKLTEIMARLARLSDDDLEWLDDVLAAVLKHR